jgi:hypothetical protein
MGHLAPNGLLYYSQVLDGFFHDAIALQSELPAPAPAVSPWTDAVFSIPGDPRFPTAPGRIPRPVLRARDSRQGDQDQLGYQFSKEEKP